MSQFLSYSPKSLQELKRIIDWCNELSPGLGDRFKTNFLSEIQEIKKFLFSRSFRYEQVRFEIIQKFPHAAHYTLDEFQKLVKIQVVVGFAQDSNSNWKMRF